MTSANRYKITEQHRMDKNRTVVTRQPTNEIALMPFPGQFQGCPPGLEYMAAIDQLICKQEVSLFEVLTGIEAVNKYRVFNTLNQQAYWALEESDCCNRIYCGPNRGFVFHITDNSQQDVMTIVRPFLCCKGCCCCADGCCKYPIYVNDRAGQLLGIVRMMNSCWTPHFGIFDHNEVLLYEIWGPCCPCQCACGCTDDIEFPIKSVKDNTQVGTVSKVWAGSFREMLTDADTYSVRFPVNLDVRHKALMFACIFLIDFAVFETQKNNNK
ncbi:phospholipid scramblase 1-like isoform X1 [Biomphalaria glabrata]|uniref:Phospholipid scramblase n=2 Tax=Biomphalaria glabrata TaxID=6526 RepID=A0A9U8DYF1_BIOGL|nr:phospholipid scramblase 1-like isoform X1 [Biomphalaria glabrata]